jgi:hypothetical protein
MLRRNNTVLALLSSARTSRMTLSERSRNCSRYCMVVPVPKRRGAAANHDLAAAISTNHLQRGAGGFLPIATGPRQRTPLLKTADSPAEV